MAKRKRQARRLTDEHLDALAQITEQDIEAARRWWAEHAPDGYEDLLDAVVDRDGAADDPTND
jgi:DNA-binding GntR family transcriptional regulator